MHTPPPRVGLEKGGGIMASVSSADAVQRRMFIVYRGEIHLQLNYSFS